MERSKTYSEGYRETGVSKIITKQCKVCGKEFKQYFSTAKFCSRKCFHEDSKISRVGKNNPAYRNGFYVTEVEERKKKRKLTMGVGQKEFLRNAKKIREDQIKNHGFYFCEHCGVNNSLRWETHHLVKRSEAPLHKNLHNPNNLVRVCIKCHNTFHKELSTRDLYVEERKLKELFPEIYIL